MQKDFLNLDILKSDKSKRVRFLGKDFELSYIPCGIAIPIVELHNCQVKKEVSLKGAEVSQQEMIQVELKMVSLFCSFYEKEFSEEYISKNANDKQLYAMYMQIVNSITENFGVPSSKDEEDTDGKKKQTGEK